MSGAFPTKFPNHAVDLGVNARHKRRGVPLDPERCALAVCAVTTITGCLRAQIFKTVAYLYFADHREKYKVPTAVSREIHHFDRSHDLPLGTYVLRPIPPSGRAKRQVGKQRGKGGGAPRHVNVPNPLVRPSR